MEKENKLIAEFMGLTVVSGKVLHAVPDKPTELLRAMQYHTSWDWLMPVVEKIDDNGAVTIITNGCKIETLDNEFTTCGETTLISVYAAVVQFINWYNEQQLTQITNP